MQEKELYERIGKNIKQCRLDFGFTQEKLSELMGMDDSYIGHIERAERQPSLKRLMAVAKIFNIDILELFKK